MVLIIMGVASSGKTTVGRALSAALGWSFIEGDELHSPGSIRKMASGVPLMDEDRAAWLDRIHALAARLVSERTNAIITCSALKRAYRDRIRREIDPGELRFIFLSISPALARRRANHREGHFFPASLVESQFETLEEPRPEEALVIPAEAPPERIVQHVIGRLGLRRSA